MLPKNPSKLKKKPLKQEDMTSTIKTGRPKFSNSRFLLISYNCRLVQSSDQQPVLAVKDVPDYIVSTARSKRKTLAERQCGTCAVPLPVPETNTKQSTHGQSVATGILKMSPRRTAGRNCHFFRVMSSQETSCAFFRMTVEPLKPVWAQQRVEALFTVGRGSAHVPTNFNVIMKNMIIKQESPVSGHGGSCIMDYISISANLCLCWLWLVFVIFAF